MKIFNKVIVALALVALGLLGHPGTGGAQRWRWFPC